MCVLFRVGRILLPAKENIKSDLDEAEKMNQNKNAVIPYLRHYSIGNTSLPGLEPGASCLGEPIAFLLDNIQLALNVIFIVFFETNKYICHNIKYRTVSYGL